MSTWTTPATWVNGAVTAAQMNAEIRDHANWLKGAIDLITGSTASDVGVTTKLAITRADVADDAFTAKQTGDAVNRILIGAGGRITWQNGADTSGKVELYKNGADILRTDDSLEANDLTTDQGVVILGTSGQALLLDGGGGIEMVERTAPAAPGGNRVTIYAEDNGAGKTRLMCKFNTGAAQQIAIMP